MIFGCCVLAALAIAIDVEAYNLFGRFLDPYAVAMVSVFVNKTKIGRQS